MRSPWRRAEPMAAEGEYLVLASRIPARRYSATPQLFRGASATKRQLRGADGLIGYSLLARPARKQYATLSVWRDEAALQAFVRATPHRELMRELVADMGPTAFVRWTIRGSDGRPTWSDALQRLDASPVS